jgi:hypothetical protein
MKARDAALSWTEALPADIPRDSFRRFATAGADRFLLLDSLLCALKLHYSVVRFAGSRHFFVSSRLKERPRSVLLAHYDAACGSPGANDNASSVFILILAALELSREADGPWMVIFTDKEEVSGALGIRAQGAYTLALGLKNTGLAKAGFYVFDSCGRGDTLIFSTIADNLTKNEGGRGAASARKKLLDLRNAAFKAAGRSFDNFMLLPAPFSDDAGFLHAGLAAQMITVLPRAEAAAFASLSRARPEYIGALVSSAPRQIVEEGLLPGTWRMLNGPDDSEDKLSAQLIPQLVKFAVSLEKN